MANTFLFHVDDRSVADDGDEHGIQVRFCGRIRTIAPRIKLLAVPNQGQRSAYGNIRMRAEGLHKGAWDIQALAQGETAWIEFKDRKGALSPEQIDFGNWLLRNGFRCSVRRSADTAEAWLRSLWPHLFLSEAEAA